jgi:hypothetical protein
LKLRKKVYTIRRKKKFGDTNAATLDTFSCGSGGGVDHNMIPSQLAVGTPMSPFERKGNATTMGLPTLPNTRAFSTLT